MSVFATYAGNSNQLLSSDYAAAAQQIDMQCGPRFVESSVPNTSAAGDSLTPKNYLGSLLAVLFCVLLSVS